MSSPYPAGTVTFLFTDIEGSTRLLQELGDDYATVVGDHRRILREAFAAADGREVDTQGDAFFYSFRRARDAVSAAVAGQRTLEAHEWPRGAAVRVRMGLHTGEPAVGDEGYIGLDVVRASRICSAGHGGQVLLSETTRALVGGDLPEGVSIRDLGEQDLKDVRAEHLYQLDLGGSPQYFPMLRTERGSGSAADDLGARISKHVESLVEAQLQSVFAGGKPPTAKLAGLTAVGLTVAFVVLAGLVGIGFLVKVAFF
ncbi:MAG TPA: adenylate/guanylate cyclase domain-containing protein [Gaiellaceae bacterium]|nr:adenylate/guanylate cyclase domain-containing protein [Gaiellaceae bacterium]